MGEEKSPDFREYYSKWAEELASLTQNKLLDARQFSSFAWDRRIGISSLRTEIIADFYRRGWLACDDTDDKGNPRYHVFRIYTLHKILESREFYLLYNETESLKDEESSNLAEELHQRIRVINNVTDLAVLLEPIYWPTISGHITYNASLNDEEFLALREKYRPKVLDLVRSLDPNYWREAHERLRITAAQIDDNSELYILLRVGNWEQRKKLKGVISGALWVRHIAEVLRRAFEEVHKAEWYEEDRAFGMWGLGARKITFGSERPIEDPLASKPYLAYRFGLFTGSLVRWYVEGDTEYWAVLHIISEPARIGLELVNLKGNIAADRDNAAVRLGEWLREDKALRRFSVITFDADSPTNLKVIRRQIDGSNIVGLITANRPDFEFANFALNELIEICARLDEAVGISGDSVRNADWTRVWNGKTFERRYLEVSARRPPSLKGKEWGIALATYADEHPYRSDTGERRPFLDEVSAAVRARFANYDFQKESSGFDRETFKIIDIRKT